jgi:hypothetical protein
MASQGDGKPRLSHPGARLNRSDTAGITLGRLGELVRIAMAGWNELPQVEVGRLINSVKIRPQAVMNAHGEARNTKNPGDLIIIHSLGQPPTERLAASTLEDS